MLPSTLFILCSSSKILWKLPTSKWKKWEENCSLVNWRRFIFSFRQCGGVAGKNYYSRRVTSTENDNTNFRTEVLRLLTSGFSGKIHSGAVELQSACFQILFSAEVDPRLYGVLESISLQFHQIPDHWVLLCMNFMFVVKSSDSYSHW